jgi:hypothetical protein
MNNKLGKRKRRMTSQDPKAAGETDKPSNQEQNNSTEPCPEASSARREIHAPKACTKSCKNEKHWLDYATGMFAFVAAFGGAIAGGAAAYQGWVARHSEIVSNRAFIVANSVRFITYIDPSTDPRWWQIAPVIENTGNTPTKNLRFVAGMGICAAGMPSKAAIENMLGGRDPPKDHFAKNVIGPKAAIIGSSFNMANSQITCPWTAVAVGIVKFEDVFDNPHITEFCSLIRAPNIDFKNFPTGQPISVQGISCNDHNCSDEECGPDWEKRADK